MRAAPFLAVLLAAQTPVSPPRDRATAEPPGAAISGRITEQGSGLPVGRAIVTLASANRPAQLETVADGDGAYAFRGVEPGEYILWAGPPELRATHLRQVYGQSDAFDSMAPMPRAKIQLPLGAVRTGMDIALVRALGIEGRVLDPWNEPMAHVEVRLMRMNGAPVPAHSVSDDRGAFRLFGVAPGRYRVCAEAQNPLADAPNADISRFVRTCHPASTTEADANDVVVTTGDATGIDIRMQRSGTYSVSGSVVDAGGGPVEGAFVGAYSVDDLSVSANATSVGGQFVLRGLTAGRYLVTATAGRTPFPDRDRPAPDVEMGAVHVDVGSDVSGFAIHLARQRTVTGRVAFEGRSAPAATHVRLVVQTYPLHEWSRAIASRPPFAAVDDNLNFTLTGVYRIPLIVGLSGLPDGWALRAVRYAGRDITDIASDLESPSDPAQIEIVLTDRTSRAVVRVSDDRGGPATAFRVIVLPSDPARWQAGRWLAEPPPASDGMLRLTARPPGEYLIAALTPADFLVLARPGARGIERVAGLATRVTLVEGNDQVVKLRLAALPPQVGR